MKNFWSSLTRYRPEISKKIKMSIILIRNSSKVQLGELETTQDQRVQICSRPAQEAEKLFNTLLQPQKVPNRIESLLAHTKCSGHKIESCTISLRDGQVFYVEAPRKTTTTPTDSRLTVTRAMPGAEYKDKASFYKATVIPSIEHKSMQAFKVYKVTSRLQCITQIHEPAA